MQQRSANARMCDDMITYCENVRSGFGSSGTAPLRWALDLVTDLPPFIHRTQKRPIASFSRANGGRRSDIDLRVSEARHNIEERSDLVLSFNQKARLPIILDGPEGCSRFGLHFSITKCMISVKS